MRPILLYLGALPIASYWAMLALAGLVSIAVAIAGARRIGVNVGPVLVCFGVAWTVGLAAARLGSVFWGGHFHAYLLWPQHIAVMTRGGYSAQAGMIGGGVAVLVACRRLGWPSAAIADLAVPAVAAGFAVGRIGCLLAGCCYGRPTLFPIALVFEDFGAAARPVGVPLHATQAYMAGGYLIIAAALFAALGRRTAPRGTVACLGLTGEGTLRFLIEFIRGDPRGVALHGVPLQQVLAASFVFFGLVGFRLLARRATGVDASVDPIGTAS